MRKIEAGLRPKQMSVFNVSKESATFNVSKRPLLIGENCKDTSLDMDKTQTNVRFLLGCYWFMCFNGFKSPNQIIC